jgi:hypothetical protein
MKINNAQQLLFGQLLEYRFIGLKNNKTKQVILSPEEIQFEINRRLEIAKGNSRLLSSYHIMMRDNI